MNTWSYDDMLEWLDSHVSMEAIGITRVPRPTLDRIRQLCDIMGNPERAQPVIHITGTNGKGSTARMVTELLVARGLSVGTYSSPNLQRVNERISYCNEPISDEDFCSVMFEIASFERMLDFRLSRFELLTACAYKWFADRPVDVAVIEVGLGGLWDATNVAEADVAVITNISYDHVEILGPTLRDIATEKAGIIKNNSIVVVGEQGPELVKVFEAASASVGALQTMTYGKDFSCPAIEPVTGGLLLSLHTPWSTHEDLFLSLYGKHQGRNAVLAVTAVEAFFNAAYPADLLQKVFAKISFAGRCEVLGRNPLIVCDGAHNVAGMEALASLLRDYFVDLSPKVLVTGMLEGRDPEAMLQKMRYGGVDKVVVVPAPSQRSIDVDILRNAAVASGFEAVLAESIVEGLQLGAALAGTGGMLVIAGSLYVVGAARSYMMLSTGNVVK